jgi:hypothetical protein
MDQRVADKWMPHSLLADMLEAWEVKTQHHITFKCQLDALDNRPGWSTKTYDKLKRSVAALCQMAWHGVPVMKVLHVSLVHPTSPLDCKEHALCLFCAHAIEWAHILFSSHAS